jgi:hypothetical protein
MTIEKAAPTSVAEALDMGIALADAGNAPPVPPADDDDGGGDGGSNDDSTDTTGADGADSTDTSGGDASGDQSGDAGDGTGQDGDGADPKDGEAGADGAGGDVDADADEAARLAAEQAGKTGDQGSKKPDPLTDPIPNALKRETKERIRTLVDRTKTAETSLTQVTKDRDELISAITDTGATPQQYAATLDYLEWVNSGDRNKQIKAANFMLRELSALSRIGGFRIPGVTTYAGHKDLEEKVAAGQLTPELAEEIAASRNGAAHQGKVGAAQQQASQQRQAYEAADTKARADMNELEAGYRKADPLYKEKQPIIIAMLNEQIKGDRANGIPPIHPSKWPALFANIYKTLPKTLGGMRPVARPGAGQPGGRVPANQPLRTQQPAGATKPEPKSIAEALEMGIDMARGG